jgi:hypothetical protein
MRILEPERPRYGQDGEQPDQNGHSRHEAAFRQARRPAEAVAFHLEVLSEEGHVERAH